MLDKFKNQDLKKVFNNFVSLFVLNIVNYIFPILTVPILINSLGIEVFGRYIYTFAILGYLNLIVQYGFNFSATKKIAKSQLNENVISETYSSITILRLLFSIAIILAIFILSSANFDMTLYFYGIGLFLGQGLIPIWLFQGLERMKVITIINSIVRVLSFICIVLFIKIPEDLNLLLFIQSLSFFIGSVISMLIVKFSLKIRFIFPKKNSLISNLKDGWSLFLSTIGMNLYRESNVVILGLISGYSVVGLYTPAEKLIKGLQSFSNTIVIALYPYFSRKTSEDKKLAYFNLIRTGKVLSLFFFMITIVVLLFAPFIIDIYLPNGNVTTVVDLRILSLIIFFGGLNYFYGIIGLVNFGHQNTFNYFVWISGLVGILLSIVLSYFYQDNGAAVSMVIAESILLILIIRKIFKIL